MQLLGLHGKAGHFEAHSHPFYELIEPLLQRGSNLGVGKQVGESVAGSGNLRSM